MMKQEIRKIEILILAAGQSTRMIGINKLRERAEIVRKNQKFAEKVKLILEEEYREKSETKTQQDE